MELYIVRHGQSESNAGLEIDDPALTQTGRLQARLAGEALKNVRFDKVYVSHLKRAVQTAAATLSGQAYGRQDRQYMRDVTRVLLALEVRLHRQKWDTAPKTMDDPITTEYAQNCQMYDFIVGLADLLSGGTEQQKADEIAYLTGGVLDSYEALLQKEVIEYGDIF